MRVIHIIPAISEESSGPTYCVVRLCESLLNCGNDVTLAALDWAPLISPPRFLQTFPLGAGPPRLGRSPMMYQWLLQQCSGGKVDVLHNNGMWQMNAVYPALAAKGRNIQVIYSPHGAFSEWAMTHGSRAKRIFWPFFQLPALRRADCFHATAEAEYYDIRRLGFRQPVAIIPNGVDIPERLSYDRSSGQRSLLFISRIHKVKGLEYLLRAWSQVENYHPEWRLQIVGSDEGYHGSTGYLEELKKLSSSLQLKSVKFLGAMHGEAKKTVFSQAELLVLPTFSENFGMVVAEALAMATPAIVTKGAPWSGLIEQGAGWWIDIGVEPLVAALREALSRSPEELSAMGQRGRLWMQRDFSWPSIGARMADTYRWLCDRTLPAPSWVRLD